MNEISMNELDSNLAAKPVLDRRKLEPVRRNLTVKDVRALTPHMIRVILGGDDLAGFVSPSSDDHIKLFFPMQGSEGAKRDYTPRSFDLEARTLCVDFALHECGIGSAWARQAKLGDQLQIAGPRGSTVISAPGAWWLLVCDETALPSIGRRLEEFASETQVISLVAVTGPEEEQEFETTSHLTALWVHRRGTERSDPGPFFKALSEWKRPAGPGFIWIGAEEGVARALRTYFIDTIGHPPEWIKASAYWSQKPNADE
jgi:NADPH-dependent ferric siderophore reductase